MTSVLDLPMAGPMAGPGATAAAPSLVLTFTLNGETFALDVGRVHEIIDPLPMTRVPRADPFVPSLINVRGAIVPVVDVQTRLGMRRGTDERATRLVVIEVTVEDEPTKVALIVDGVNEVIEIDGASIEEIPELGARWPGEFIRGIALRGDELIVLLNTETLFRPRRGQVRALN